MVQLNF